MCVGTRPNRARTGLSQRGPPALRRTEILAATPLDCCRAPVMRDYVWHVRGWQVLAEPRDHVGRIGCSLANCACVRVRMRALLDSH